MTSKKNVASMPRRLKQRWVDALRSGEYKQGDKYLYNPKDKSFCCLGVLQHVAMKGKVEIRSLSRPRVGGVDSGPTYAAVPSSKFYKKFNINLKAGAVEDDLLYDCSCVEDMLIDMNDFGEFSFAEIAEYIERNVRGR